MSPSVTFALFAPLTFVKFSTVNQLFSFTPCLISTTQSVGIRKISQISLGDCEFTGSLLRRVVNSQIESHGYSSFYSTTTSNILPIIPEVGPYPMQHRFNHSHPSCRTTSVYDLPNHRQLSHYHQLNQWNQPMVSPDHMDPYVCIFWVLIRRLGATCLSLSFRIIICRTGASSDSSHHGHESTANLENRRPGRL